MLSRSRIIQHPQGIRVVTPILVSSFSTKGFRFLEKDKKLLSEAFELIENTAEYLTEAVLLSCYDLEYYFPDVEKMRKFSFVPKLTFLDSGGYETIDDYDFTEGYKHPIIKNEWNESLHLERLNKWSRFYPAVFISYDNGSERRRELKSQIKRAEKLFEQYPNQLKKKFNIIGFTEKELGESIIERMKNIKCVREALDNIKCSAPIHIFGNLDPLTSVLYFIAGAEIFDGLTWLRFSFFEGRSVYMQNIDAVKNRIQEKDRLNYKLNLVENLIYMRNLQAEMIAFANTDKTEPEKALHNFKYISREVLSAYKILYSK